MDSCYFQNCDLQDQDLCGLTELVCWDQETGEVVDNYKDTDCDELVIDYCCKIQTNCGQFSGLNYATCEDLKYPEIVNAWNYYGISEIRIEMSKDYVLDLGSSGRRLETYNCYEIFKPVFANKLGSNPTCTKDGKWMTIKYSNTSISLTTIDKVRFEDIVQATHKDAYYHSDPMSSIIWT